MIKDRSLINTKLPTQTREVSAEKTICSKITYDDITDQCKELNDHVFPVALGNIVDYKIYTPAPPNQPHNNLQAQDAKYLALLEFSQLIYSTRDPEELLRLAIAKIGELLDAQFATLYLVEQQKKEVWEKVTWGRQNTYTRLSVGSGLVGSVAQTGQVINIVDSQSDPRFDPEQENISEQGIHNLLTMPVQYQPQAEIIGVIQVGNNHIDQVFSTEDQRVLSMLSSQIAIFLANARLMQDLRTKNLKLNQLKRQLKQHQEEFDIIYDIEQQMSHSHELDDILSNILRRVVVLLRCEAATLALIENKQDRIFLYSADREDPDEVLIVSAHIRSDQGFLGHTLHSGEPLMITHPQNDPRFYSDLAAKLHFTVHSVLCVPFCQDGTCKGAIELLNKDNTKGFTQNDLRLVQQIASQINRAIEIGERRAEQFRENRLATIGKLLSGILHDFKGPMTIISGYAQMLNQPLETERREKFSHSIFKQIEQLNQMIREVLAFARGKTTLLIRKINMSEFISELKENLQQEFIDTNIEIEIQEKYKGYAHFDQIKIQRLISNLARNARQAMPSGGKFTLTIDKIDENLQMMFSDTGKGIPEELQHYIFESFVSGHPEHGSGLGLAIVKKIIEAHNGHIQFNSSPQGTCFCVSIPIDLKPPSYQLEPSNYHSSGELEHYKS